MSLLTKPSRPGRLCAAKADLATSIDGDREIQDDVVRRRQVGLEACQHLVRARRGGEKPLFHLLDGLEADELVGERLREAPAAEIPAVELLQEASSRAARPSPRRCRA